MEQFWCWNENNVIWDVTTHVECEDRKLLLRVLTDLIDTRKELQDHSHRRLFSAHPQVKLIDDRINWILNKLKSFEEY